MKTYANLSTGYDCIDLKDPTNLNLIRAVWPDVFIGDLPVILDPRPGVPERPLVAYSRKSSTNDFLGAIKESKDDGAAGLYQVCNTGYAIMVRGYYEEKK